jgi:hypothetical protein
MGLADWLKSLEPRALKVLEGHLAKKERLKSHGFICCRDDPECMEPCPMRRTELYGH